jgi:L-lactate dehydrogenase complex protein LldF
MKAAAWSFGSGARLRSVERLSGLVGRVAGRMSRHQLPGGRSAVTRGFAAWTGARDLPLPPAESFRDWWRRTGGGRE